MIYCPKCNKIVNETICPYCYIDIMCYNEQMNEIKDEHFDSLRSNHRVMKEMIENQEDMNDILRKEMY